MAQLRFVAGDVAARDQDLDVSTKGFAAESTTAVVREYALELSRQMAPSKSSIYLIGQLGRDPVLYPGADIDLAVITDEKGRARVGQLPAVLAGARLDATILATEEMLRAGLPFDRARAVLREVVYPVLQHGIRLVGDRVDALLQQSIAVHELDLVGRMMPWRFMRLARGMHETLARAVIEGPPDPADDFLGYLNVNPKIPVLIASWIGTAFAEADSHRLGIASKADAIRALAPLRPDVAKFIEELVTFSREDLCYGMPQTPEQSLRMAAACRQLYALERGYVASGLRFW
jgi:hypothetical protein